MTTVEWIGSSGTITVEDGKIIKTSADPSFGKMGEKPNIKMLQATGWRKRVLPGQSFVKGDNGRMFSNAFQNGRQKALQDIQKKAALI